MKFVYHDKSLIAAHAIKECVDEPTYAWLTARCLIRGIAYAISIVPIRIHNLTLRENTAVCCAANLRRIGILRS